MKEKALELFELTIEAIDVIDKNTKADSDNMVEPKWWLEMMIVQRALYKAVKNMKGK